MEWVKNLVGWVMERHNTQNNIHIKLNKKLISKLCK